MNHNNFTRRRVLMTGAALAGACALPAMAQEGTTTRIIEEMFIGDENAPVTVVEYASLTCPHCAAFHNEVFGKIKTNYIETGKVKFVVRDVYFDRYGLWGAMVARCGGREKYFGITDLLYKRQPEWSRQQDPADAIAAIFAIGRQAGMTNEEMDACVQDQVWAEELVKDFQWNMQSDEVTGTPTFFINGQRESNMPYNAFAAKLDAALGS